MNEPINDMDWMQKLKRERDAAIDELIKCRARVERWHTKAVECQVELKRLESNDAK